MPEPRLTFLLADKAVGGNLAELLERWRSQSESYETIARRLANNHDLDVSSATVGRWCRDLEAAS